MVSVRLTQEFQDWLDALKDRRGSILIVMLAGGDKSSQARDIKRAQRILIQLELEP